VWLTSFDAVGESYVRLPAADFVADVTDDAPIRYIRYPIRCRFRQQHHLLPAHSSRRLFGISPQLR
jgi:hypothetical protein